MSYVASSPLIRTHVAAAAAAHPSATCCRAALLAAVARGRAGSAGAARARAADYVPARGDRRLPRPARRRRRRPWPGSASRSQRAGGPLRAARVLHLRSGESVSAASRGCGASPASPTRCPTTSPTSAGAWYPDDRAAPDRPQGWERMQWNMLPGDGRRTPRRRGPTCSPTIARAARGSSSRSSTPASRTATGGSSTARPTSAGPASSRPTTSSPSNALPAGPQRPRHVRRRA